MNSINNQMIYSSIQTKDHLSNLKTLLLLDKDPSKPKRMKEKGIFTDKFLKWNRKLI